MGVDQSKSKFAAKWPEDVAQRGFVPIPKCLITCMTELGLKPQEAVVLFNILERCWKAGDKAWPGVDYLATNTGRKNSATRAITKSLAQKGFITKEQRFNTVSLYDPEPTARKLAAHIGRCRHIARNPNPQRHKSSGQDSQKPSDYIEPDLTRTNNLETNLYSRNFNKIEASDHTPLTGKYSRAVCPATGDEHMWEEFEVERLLNKEEDELVTYYYYTCISCHDQYHKKGERPWPAEYPLYGSNN